MFDPTRPVILLNPRNARVRAIARGLFPKAEFVEWRMVGVSLRRAPPADLDRAAASATRGGQSGLKRWFLGAQHRWLYHTLAQCPPSTLVCWNGIKGHRFLATEAAKALGHQVVYLEEAPFPGRIAIDTKGVNAGNSVPRDAAAFDGLPPAGLGSLRDGMRPRASARADVEQAAAGEDLKEHPFIFAPLQVPGDSQITVYGDWIKSVDHMIAEICAAADALPDGWSLRVKEHPSAKQSLADLVQGDKVVLDNATDTFAQVAASRGVVTINSSVGLQAMLWDKPVLALGQAFWGWAPLAQRATSSQSLRAAFGAPEWSFDRDLRLRVLRYLAQDYFPSEAEVVDGLPIETLFSRRALAGGAI